MEQSLMYGHVIDDILQVSSRSFWEEHPFSKCAYLSEQHYFGAQALCLTQAETFLQLLGPLQVNQVELEITSPLVHPLTGETHEDISLRGFIDMIVQDNDGNTIIVDIKTVGRKGIEGMSRVALELSFYAYLYNQPFTEQTIAQTAVALLYLVRTKNQQVFWDESRRSLYDYVQLYNLCISIDQSIKHGKFWMNPGMHCSWCDFKSLCYSDSEAAIETFGEEIYEYYLNTKNQREFAVITEIINF